MDHAAGDDLPEQRRKDTAEVLWASDVLKSRRDCVSSEV